MTQREKIAPKVTERDIKILDLLVDGKSDIEIAESLNVSIQTIKNRISYLKSALGANNRIHMLVRAYKKKYIKI